MALSLTEIERGVMGDLNYAILDIDFDSSYPTGGESLTANDVGMDAIHFLLAEPTSGYVFEYGSAVLLAYYVDNDGAADGAMIQVANATNLSSVANVRTFILGR
jgi:hypothetical protein